MDFTVRTYCRATRTPWFSSNPLKVGTIEEYMLGFSHSGGGTTGEFCIECSLLEGRKVFKVKAYSDSMKSLVGFSDILMQLGQLDENETLEDDIEKVLKNNNILNYLDKPEYMGFK